MDTKITLNGEVYIKESEISKPDKEQLIEFLEDTNCELEIYEIAEILKNRLGDKVESGAWISKSDIDINCDEVRDMILYKALIEYC